MEIKVIQISSLEKLGSGKPFDGKEIAEKKVMAGERFSYQIGIRSDEWTDAKVSVESPLKKYIKIYLEKNAVVDLPAREAVLPEEDYLITDPGYLPDVLVPAEEQKNRIQLMHQMRMVWIRVDVPKTADAGTYEIKIIFSNGQFSILKTMQLSVISEKMPEQKLIYTRWFHTDCIAVQHHVDIYSEEHWKLIKNYIKTAADMGINMILVPAHTPPLDTEIGSTRPCVQLIDIEKKGEGYQFSFEKFKRFIDICKENGIKYFEMPHMFSQWGAKYAPNIQVTENGKKEYLFGWHVLAESPEYVSFLKQYIQAIAEELKKEGISENTYFHISDEPTLETLETYQRASEMIRPLIGKSKTFDALSNYVFCEKGLVECPITVVSEIHDFLQYHIKNQWVYYALNPETVFTNSFIAMPLYRIRVIGFLMYKYQIKGFLHWGFNFYNSQLSRYPINPYLTTSADQAFPSGDPFLVYPSTEGAYSSMRGEVMYEAIQDMNICFALERKVGRNEVVSMIDRAAGFDLRFDHYPKNKEFLENLRKEMIDLIDQINQEEQ